MKCSHDSLYAAVRPVTIVLMVIICLVCSFPEKPVWAELPGTAEWLWRRVPAIVGGRVDKGHPAVGLFITKSKPCTATLIGKRTVLTAAHSIDAGFEHTFILDGITYEMESAVKHPKFSVSSRPPSETDPLDYSQHDLAIVRLKKAPPVEPAIVNTNSIQRPLVISVVGLGETRRNRNDRGTKRVAENTIAILFRGKYQFNDRGSICHGDSGGPSFATIEGREVLVGVHSVVSNPCGVFGVDMRVDFYTDWIKQTASGDVVLSDKR